MNKKIYLQKFLNLIKKSWPPARGILFLLENDKINDKIINILITTIKKSILQNKSEKLQLHKKQKILLLNKLEEKELDENNIDNLLLKI